MTSLYIALLSLAIGFLLGYRAKRVRSSQNHGELLVCDALQKNFPSPDYHLLNHITLKHDGRTTQIDHILISRFGVFVIETKNYKGWIFANAQHDTWTQVLFHANFKFQNPINQNYRHVVAVRELLDFLPDNAVKSAVVFTGKAEFKTDVPVGVFTLSKLISHIKSYSEELLSLNRVQFSVGRIETARLEISQETDLAHINALKKRYGK